MKTLQLKPQEIDRILGGSVLKPWKLVVEPFQPEYPGDRKWNRFSPRFRYKYETKENYDLETWDLIFKHIGQGIDVTDSIWCKQNGVQDGADYLRLWLASMFQYPTEPLPYLFLFSNEQNTGKSIFHESLSLLFQPGYASGNNALRNKGDFNGEIEGAVLCAVEEIDLGSEKTAYERIKNWVTSPTMTIHKKGATPYNIPNTSHWVHCANNADYVPVFPGDTRITMVHVPQLESEVPKPVFFERLKKEAPDFIAAMLTMPVPPSDGRLRIPVIDSKDKLLAASAHRSSLEIFIEENVHEIPGAAISLKDFYNTFKNWLPKEERIEWGYRSTNMKIKYPKGRLTTDPNWHWGNVSFDPDVEPSAELVLVGEGQTAKLVRDV